MGEGATGSGFTRGEVESRGREIRILTWVVMQYTYSNLGIQLTYTPMSSVIIPMFLVNRSFYP